MAEVANLNWFEMLIIALATWRVSSLLVFEDGPNAIFAKFRYFIGIRPGQIDGILPMIFTCIWCISIWLIPIMITIQQSGYIGESLIALLAGSAIVILIEQLIRR